MPDGLADDAAGDLDVVGRGDEIGGGQGGHGIVTVFRHRFARLLEAQRAVRN